MQFVNWFDFASVAIIIAACGIFVGYETRGKANALLSLKCAIMQRLKTLKKYVLFFMFQHWKAKKTKRFIVNRCRKIVTQDEGLPLPTTRRI